jgi:hypothetical protein
MSWLASWVAVSYSVCCCRVSWCWYSSAALARGPRTSKSPRMISRSAWPRRGHTVPATATPGAAPWPLSGHQVWTVSSRATATRTDTARGIARRAALCSLGRTAPVTAAASPGASSRASRRAKQVVVAYLIYYAWTELYPRHLSAFMFWHRGTSLAFMSAVPSDLSSSAMLFVFNR